MISKISGLLIFLTATLLIGCDKSSTSSMVKPVVTPPLVSASDPYFTVYYDLTSLPVSDAFEPARNLGKVQNPILDEISGIGAGSSVSNTLWSQEDSGNENSIYLMRTSGEFLGTVQMTSITNRDWEDLAIAPGPDPALRYIYLAETGDNNNANADKYIFRFPEPVFSTTVFPFNTSVNVVDKIYFQYPDGNKNAEALMVDPLTKDIYIISKENQAVVYVARYPQKINSTFMITKLGVLPISTVTAADISPDGNEIMIKNYAMTLYWKKSGEESVSELLRKTPVRVPYQIEEKGESICWANDGSGYFTTSELPEQPVYFYKRK